MTKVKIKKSCVEGHEGGSGEVKEGLEKEELESIREGKDTRTFQVQNRAENKTSVEDGPAWPERRTRPSLGVGIQGPRGIPGKGFYPRGGTDVTTLAFQTDQRPK